MKYIKDNNITSLVVMGGHYNNCVKESIIGRGIFDDDYEAFPE